MGRSCKTGRLRFDFGVDKMTVKGLGVTVKEALPSVDHRAYSTESAFLALLFPGSLPVHPALRNAPPS